MFSFSSGQQPIALKQAHKWWESSPRGKLMIKFLSSLPEMRPSNQYLNDPRNKAVKDQIKASNWGQKEDLESEPDEFDRFLDLNHDLLLSEIGFGKERECSSKGFPPKFVHDLYIRKVFLKKYTNSDFSQALLCLDYLSDLEETRQLALRNAIARLGIHKDSWKGVLLGKPEAYGWVTVVQKLELIIEAYYATIYVDLRIWTMIHELQSTPFYKVNLFAMLNTLFPPNTRYTPNKRVNVKVLHKYRATFYGYIRAVGGKKPEIFQAFVDRLLQPEAKHSWQRTRNALESYLELAADMIKQANAVVDLESFEKGASRRSKTISSGSGETPGRFPYGERPRTSSSVGTSFDGRSQSDSLPKSSVLGSDSNLNHRPNHPRVSSSTSEVDSILRPPPPLFARLSDQPSTTVLPPLSIPISQLMSTSHKAYAPPVPSPLSETYSITSFTNSSTSPSDPFDFLNYPYSETPAPEAPTLKKKKSLTDFLLRRKLSSTNLVDESVYKTGWGELEPVKLSIEPEDVVVRKGEEGVRKILLEKAGREREAGGRAVVISEGDNKGFVPFEKPRTVPTLPVRLEDVVRERSRKESVGSQKTKSLKRT